MSTETPSVKSVKSVDFSKKMNPEKFQPQIARKNADVPSAGTHLCPSATSAAKEENAGNWNEIVLYRPDENVRLEVRVDGGNVWLSRRQLAELFGRDVKTIGKHISNALREELRDFSVVAKFATTAADGKNYLTEHYNLEVVTSIGYRVKSPRGVQFRIWANAVLKKYLLRGFAVNQRIERLEKKVAEHDERIEFFVRTTLPPVEGIFFDGQIFDAFAFVSDLVKSAERKIVLVDNYVDESVLAMMSAKRAAVAVEIYTRRVPAALQLAARKFNEQYGELSLTAFEASHDRFLLIDDVRLYLIGASLKDLGKKWFAFSQLGADLIPAVISRLPKGPAK